MARVPKNQILYEGRNNMAKKTIGVVGPDGRTCMCAYTISTVESEKFVGAIIKGMTGMGLVLDAVRGKKKWAVKIFPVQGNSVADYKSAIITAFENGEIDYVVIMPEDLIYEGIVNELIEAGYGDQVIGLTKEADSPLNTVCSAFWTFHIFVVKK